MEKEPKPAERLLLVGNPNVGKSVIFGLLTGRYATVSNYPGTTVEVMRGNCDHLPGGPEVIDTPGANSLVPMSEDEVVARNIIINAPAGVVIQVADAKNLARALVITLQLAQLGKPQILVLNMIDEATARGITIDTDALAKRLGIPVVPMVAIQKTGFSELLTAVADAAPARLTPSAPADIDDVLGELEDIYDAAGVKGFEYFAAAGLSESRANREFSLDRLPRDKRDAAQAAMDKVAGEGASGPGYRLHRHRVLQGNAIAKDFIVQEVKEPSKLNLWLQRVLIHPVWGLFAVFIVLYFGFYQFVGVFGAGDAVDFLESVVFGEYVIPWSVTLIDAVIPWQFWRDFLIGEYGVITMAFTYAIAIVLPIVTFFFLMFGAIEDSGYLPRLAVMVNRLFRVMGLNGKAVLPIVLGFGCDTMATMTARILETRKQRLIVTVLLALAIPCSAQLGIILGILGSLSIGATIIWVGTIVFVLGFVGWLTDKVVKGRRSDFIMELPMLRLPNVPNILKKTGSRISWYLREAVPLFILGTVILFAMDRLQLLGGIQNAAEPIIVGLLDLPIEATEAFVIGFLRRDYGATGLFELFRSGQMDGLQTLVALITMTLFMPCIANLLMIVKEQGLKTAVYISAFVFPFALAVGGLANWLLRASGASF